jgi:murein DD-endopeptidase MepM/ murein hydrolase activator NlpD
MPKRVVIASFLIATILVGAFPVSTTQAQINAAELERLTNEINDRNSRLDQIEAEIAAFESQLNEVGAEKKTLQSAINRLDIERKKVNAEISKTENLISSTDLEINKLVLEIQRTESDIATTKGAIAAIIRNEYKSGDMSLVELFLGHAQLSDFWGSLEAYQNVRETLSTKVSELDSYQELITGKRSDSEGKRNKLSSLKEQYGDQNLVLESNKQEQAQLLEVTKNTEQSYQQLLSSKQSAREQILQEMRDYESKLRFILEPGTVPTAGSSVFAWPLDNIIITQYFGGTEFAARNAGAYGGRAYHPGVDFGAPSGTAIKAPLAGTVRATGNTDAVPGCYSWGKWTLIDHANGLSTLYAHQSVISVSAGQQVSTGEVIGYVGSTGFSTGPHLHFTVYAKDGVNVRKFNEIKTSTSCGPATTPVAAIEAYIDPMDYLPAY